MHATPEQVVLGAHSKMFLAASPQRSLRNPDRPADLWYIQSLVHALYYNGVRTGSVLDIDTPLTGPRKQSGALINIVIAIPDQGESRGPKRPSGSAQETPEPK
jgi:hypothetical protein